MSEDFTGLFDIRDMIESDKNFIYASFLRGLYYGDSWFSLIPKQIFMDNYKLVIEALVNSPKTKIVIACLKEDPNIILGYSILSEDYQTINWVFVKKVWRKRGIARAILPKQPTSVSHLSDLGRILLPKFKDLIFNPFKV